MSQNCIDTIELYLFEFYVLLVNSAHLIICFFFFRLLVCSVGIDGVFLVRDSVTSPGDYVLSVLNNVSITTFRKFILPNLIGINSFFFY